MLPILTFTSILLALVAMWRNFIMPASILGEAEAIPYNLTAKEDGVISELAVDRFEAVKKGQLLGSVSFMDSDVQAATVAAIESDLNVLKIRMDLDRTRNLDSLARLKLAVHNERQALADAQAELQQKEKEFARVTKLYTDSGSNIVAEADLDIARRDREMKQNDVEHKTKLIAEYEAEIKKMEKFGQFEIAPKDPAIEEAIRAKKDELLQTSKPAELKAPIDGKIIALYKRAGERVRRGEIIMTIVAPTSNRVIGYVRQPLNIMPTTNDVVTVRTRSQKRIVATGKIVEVGPSWVELNPTLLATDVRRREVGLPVLIQLPPEFQLTPGEYVDISIQFAKK